MKKGLHYILTGCLLTLLLASCSTAKNTWMSRKTQALNTKYNVFFNGYESYKEGIRNINKNHVDDYSLVLPLYPISFHSNATAATGQMDRTIEKAQKAIKLHSIKKKPPRDPERMKDPKYQAFMKQEEFNEQIDETWILLGKAQFHKAEFLAAVGTFTYTINHFSWNKDAVSEARIWLARSYIEMGWYYEAEDVLIKANKEQVPGKYTGIYSATSTDLLLKSKKYKEAIPLLTIAAKEEKDKFQRTRFYYILGQLYRLEKNDAQAKYFFTKVIKSNPPSDMEFNARISRSEADTKDPDGAIKSLQRMLKNSKFVDYKDKIHYTIGNIYLKQGKQDEAVKSYKLAIENSGNNIINKVQILIAIGDLYYNQGKYIESQPFYNEATVIMPIENPEFERINSRSQLLNDLIKEYSIVQLQDSLQDLSRLSEEEKKAAIERLIKKLQAEEIAMKEKLLKDANSMENPDDLDAKVKTPSFAMKAMGDWYFYNNMLVSSGRADFKRRWGTRKLEDNWRRKNKSVLSQDDAAGRPSNPDDINADNANQQEDGFVDRSVINTDLNTYMDQIPSTSEQIDKSNEQIADALYAIGMIYKEKIEDKPMAIKTFEELERRFPKEKRLPDIYYNLYQMNMKENDTTTAESYRTQLMQKFPESFYAKMFSMPDYVTEMTQLRFKEDSIYQATYLSFVKDDYKSVMDNYELVKEKYPLSDLMPKFMFLNALSKGKTNETEPFVKGLEDLVADYPQSEVSTMARDILALVSEGMQPQAGGSHGSIMNRRDSLCLCQNQATDSLLFERNIKDKHLILIVVPKTAPINKLQYDVAIYNFTGFMIKDFDLEIKRSIENDLLIISSLDGYEEALWYLDGLLNNIQIKAFVKANNCYSMVISSGNYEMLKKGQSLDAYIDFFNKNIAEKDVQQIHKSITKITEVATFVPTNNTATPAVTLSPTNTISTVSPKENPKPIVQEAPQKTNTLKKDSIVVSVESKTTNNTSTTIKNDTVVVKDIPKPTSIIPVKNDSNTNITTKQIANDQVLKASFKQNTMENHTYAIIVQKGNFDPEILKAALNKYNAENYPLANYSITMQEISSNIIFIIGWVPYNSAKNYMFGIIRHPELFESLKNTTYRNVIISKGNLDELIRTKNIPTYLDFNRTHNMR